MYLVQFIGLRWGQGRHLRAVVVPSCGGAQNEISSGQFFAAFVCQVCVCLECLFVALLGEYLVCNYCVYVWCSARVEFRVAV